MKVYSIYKIINLVNQKAYVGFTSQSLERRWNRHLSSAKSGSHCAIHGAIRKYGKENFKFELLECSEELEYCLHVLEPKLIKEHNTKVPNGYNLTGGGDGRAGCVVSEDQKRKTSMASKKLWADPIWREKKAVNGKGWAHSEEVKKKMSLAQTNAPWKYYKRSEEVKKKMTKSRCKRKYLVTHPTGETEEVVNLVEFSKKHQLASQSMYSIVNRRPGFKSCHGFRVTILENNE